MGFSAARKADWPAPRLTDVNWKIVPLDHPLYEDPNTVYITAFDLSQGLATDLHRQSRSGGSSSPVTGVWHVEVIAFGRRYWYADFVGDQDVSKQPSTWLDKLLTRKPAPASILGLLLNQKKAGGDHFAYQAFRVRPGLTESAWLDYKNHLMQDRYATNLYHILHNNCVDFASDALHFLTGQAMPPQYADQISHLRLSDSHAIAFVLQAVAKGTSMVSGEEMRKAFQRMIQRAAPGWFSSMLVSARHRYSVGDALQFTRSSITNLFSRFVVRKPVTSSEGVGEQRLVLWTATSEMTAITDEMMRVQPQPTGEQQKSTAPSGNSTTSDDFEEEKKESSLPPSTPPRNFNGYNETICALIRGPRKRRGRPSAGSDEEEEFDDRDAVENALMEPFNPRSLASQMAGLTASRSRKKTRKLTHQGEDSKEQPDQDELMTDIEQRITNLPANVFDPSADLMMEEDPPASSSMSASAAASHLAAFEASGSAYMNTTQVVAQAVIVQQIAKSRRRHASDDGLEKDVRQVIFGFLTVAELAQVIATTQQWKHSINTMSRRMGQLLEQSRTQEEAERKKESPNAVYGWELSTRFRYGELNGMAIHQSRLIRLRTGFLAAKGSGVAGLIGAAYPSLFSSIGSNDIGADRSLTLGTDDFIRRQIQVYPLSMDCIDETKKTDALCEIAFRSAPESLQWCPLSFWTPERIVAAVEDGMSLSRVHPGQRTREVHLAAIKRDPSQYYQFEGQNRLDPEFCDAVVTADGRCLRYLEDSCITKERCILTLTGPGAYSSAIRWIPKDMYLDSSIQRAVVSRCEKDGSCLAFVPRQQQTREMCLAAIRCWFAAVSFVSSVFWTDVEVQQCCVDAITKQWSNIRNIPNERMSEAMGMAAYKAVQSNNLLDVRDVLRLLPPRARSQELELDVIRHKGISAYDRLKDSRHEAVQAELERLGGRHEYVRNDQMTKHQLERKHAAERMAHAHGITAEEVLRRWAERDQKEQVTATAARDALAEEIIAEEQEYESEPEDE